MYSFDLLVREIHRKYLIVFRYSYHAGHGIAFSSLTGIAGGLRKIITAVPKLPDLPDIREGTVTIIDAAD
jgi:hypothetical protein